DLSPSQVEELIGNMGEPSYRADQLLNWVYRRLATSFDEMSDLPLAFREKLAATISLHSIEVAAERVSDNEQTRKALFRLDDLRTVESGLMLYAQRATSRERRTVCVSTQVGCPIGCPFCATGQQGFERNLRAGEIVDQVLYFMRTVQAERAGNATGPSRPPVTNVVFMGMGEPLANYEAVKKCIEILNSQRGAGLGARNITLSTAGLVPQIRRLAREPVHVELAVSLHAPNDRLRDRLVPVNKRYPLRRVLEACADYLERTGRAPSFEYALFGGVNDSAGNARELADLLKGMNTHVNLIAGNPTADRTFSPPSAPRIAGFEKVLRACGISVSLRVSRGKDIEAGCGQLRSRYRRSTASR
ncbi:MAG: 23S rRNA (adenine(2503)-C(2))-methyltransferase RlmN, partial [Dehalococcoidia bacterium]|nr:23S rRNA (adenine(2503)-C(2))-methyltransferase RlmN [Dehalococcoidia bacterium]